MRTDPTGNPANNATFSSLPFGEPNATSGSDLDRAHFTGLDQDGSFSASSLGLHHAGAREYSSIYGRWMSPDPYLGSYDLTRPQTMNRYRYASNNPLTMVDPSGMATCDYSSYCPGGNGNDPPCAQTSTCIPTDGCEPNCSDQNNQTYTPDGNGGIAGDPGQYTFNYGWCEAGDTCSSGSACAETDCLGNSSFGASPYLQPGAFPSFGGSGSVSSNNGFGHCAGQALAKNGASLAIDGASFALNLFPGGGVVAGSIKLTATYGLGLGGTVHSALGAKSGLGMVGNLFLGGAGTAFSMLGTFGEAISATGSIAETLPLIGNIATGLATAIDVVQTGADFYNCYVGH